jgi:hypothetical protein
VLIRSARSALRSPFFEFRGKSGQKCVTQRLVRFAEPDSMLSRWIFYDSMQGIPSKYTPIASDTTDAGIRMSSVCPAGWLLLYFRILEAIYISAKLCKIVWQVLATARYAGFPALIRESRQFRVYGPCRF